MSKVQRYFSMSGIMGMGDTGGYVAIEDYEALESELAAERARRIKAEEVIEYLVNKATSLNDARNESAPYRAQYPRVEKDHE